MIMICNPMKKDGSEKKSKPMKGVRFVADGVMHRYENDDIPLAARQRGLGIASSSCPQCKGGYAEMFFPEAPVCSECRQDEWIRRVTELESELGVSLIPKTDDHAAIRAMAGFRNPVERKPKR